MENTLRCDPYNLIISGVGGQGNVLASRVIGDMMIYQGYKVTIGETFGASQRGGSVMSHLRISNRGGFSPQMPKGTAHMVVALEPMEAIRVLAAYGNPEVHVLCNTRPIQSVGVICGEQIYPEKKQIVQWFESLSEDAKFFDTTKEALNLGNPVFGNIMAVGALSSTGDLPMSLKVFEQVILKKIPADKVAINLKAYKIGKNLISDK
ncbi:MAG: indolepyruvate oxidoreductase subunit beta [Deltaproteobacteria bacterium]|uniref:indolepyruvate oxidoreductase subunit beta n=1 Tax=Desulfobacula sp. TaxID=2593537 RepID=UPI001984025E|nr:indolepyruvate oxidoreductase subunit beta [Candidatus Desulfobacula maris]MBL6992310.1 indolepyruvate oxidoreductase subunit beta [Desulfobacula sp.]